MFSKALAVASPAPSAACCTVLAAERAPRATVVRPASIVLRPAPVAASLSERAARRALRRTRLAAVLTAARRARLLLAATRRVLRLAELLALARLRLAAVLRATLRTTLRATLRPPRRPPRFALALAIRSSFVITIGALATPARMGGQRGRYAKNSRPERGSLSSGALRVRHRLQPHPKLRARPARRPSAPVKPLARRSR